MKQLTRFFFVALLLLAAGISAGDALAQSLVDDPATDDANISLDGFSIADQVEVFVKEEESTEIPVECQCNSAEDECTELLNNCVATANQEYENDNYSDALYEAFILVYCPEAWANCVLNE